MVAQHKIHCNSWIRMDNQHSFYLLFCCLVVLTNLIYYCYIYVKLIINTVNKEFLLFITEMLNEARLGQASR